MIINIHLQSPMSPWLLGYNNTALVICSNTSILFRVSSYSITQGVTILFLLKLISGLPSISVFCISAVLYLDLWFGKGEKAKPT